MLAVAAAAPGTSAQDTQSARPARRAVFLLADEVPERGATHYQFKAIHPFLDGDSRAGRILTILYLQRAGLLSIPVLYLSRFIIQNKSEYYRLLRNTTASGLWEPWLLVSLHPFAT